MTDNNLEKIQKILARAGLGSRRQLEQMIAAGRVSVDGKVVNIGARIATTARVKIDGRVVKLLPKEAEATRILVYHKTVDEICTRHDPQKRPTVFTKLPPLTNGRWLSIGRLDINTAGLLLFTNDGELAHQLMHPRQAIHREYAVRIYGQVDKEMLQRLRDGVVLEDGLAKFDDIAIGGGEGVNRWYSVVVSSGRNRMVRRLWESQHVVVSRLIRVRYGSIVLPRRLPRGRWLELPAHRVEQVKQLVLSAV